jgi:DNA invertase Pin-like site-specific DNA recombinase
MDATKSNEHKRAVIYCRVSTDEQADRGYSLESQMQACQTYAVEHGLSVVAKLREDFTGSVPIEMRPEGERAFQILRDGLADVLIVYTMDRLVRPPEDGDEWDTPVLIRSLARLNKEIHTVNRGQLKTDFASLLIAMLDAKSAGDERRKIIERTSRGKMAKAREGKVVGCGRPPYGYDFSENGLIINKNQARIVRLIYLAYVEERRTIRGIALRLSEMGIEKPVARWQHDERPTMWSHSSVYKIITSSVYKGEWYYGKVIGQNGVGGARPKRDQVRVEVPVIVDPEVWDAAQRILEQNSEIASRNRKRDYLLSGMVRCGCGYAMNANTHRGVSFYKCAERTVRHQSLEGRECFEPQFDAKNLEKIVWDYVRQLMLGDFEQELRKAQEAESTRNEPLLREVEILSDLIRHLEDEAANLARSLGRVSGVVASKLNEEIELVNQRHAQLIEKKAELERNLNDKPFSPAQVESLLAFRNNVIAGIENATREDIRRYYEILNVKVLIRNHKVKVSCLIESITS